MKDWTIRQRILASLGLIVVTVIAMGGLAYLQLLNIERQANSLQNDSLPGFYYSAYIKDALWESYSISQDFVRVGDGPERKQLDQDLQGNRTRLDRLILQYEATISATEDRRQLDAFKSTLAAYRATRDALLRTIADQGDDPELIARLKSQVYPAFSTTLAAIKTVIDWNKDHADDAARTASTAVAGAKLELLVSFVAALVLAIVCGYYLLRAITHPLKRLLAAMDVMRQGDFTQRMPVERRDEFGALGEGFNRMAADIMALVGQRAEVRHPGEHVGDRDRRHRRSSSRRPRARSLRPRPQIGATSKEISATSKELVKTMNEVSDGGRADGRRWPAAGRPASRTWKRPCIRSMEAAGSINAKLAVLNEKAGNINQVVTTITKVADQTNLLVAQCRDRGREGRRIRPRLCRGGGGNPPAGGPDGGRDLRHRADGEGDPVGRFRRRDGHGQILRGGPPRHAGRPAGRRAAVADHPAGAGAGRRASRRSTKGCRRRRPAPSRSARRCCN